MKNFTFIVLGAALGIIFAVHLMEKTPVVIHHGDPITSPAQRQKAADGVIYPQLTMPVEIETLSI